MVLNPSHLLSFRRMDKFFPCGVPDAPRMRTGNRPPPPSPCGPQAHRVVAPWLMHAPHEHLGHAAPATIPSRCEGRGARSAGDARNCEHQDFAHARPPPAKHIYIYDVLAAIQRQPCSTPSSRHIAPGMIRAGASGTTTQYDMGGIRRVAPPAPSARDQPAHPRKNRQSRRTLGQSPIPWSFCHNPNDTPSSPRKARDTPKALTRSREPPPSADWAL